MEAYLAEALRLDDACAESVFEALRAFPLADVTKGLGPSLCKETTVEVAMRTLARATAGREMVGDDAMKMVCLFFAEKSQYRNLLAPALSCLSLIACDRKSRGEQCGPETFKSLQASPLFSVKAQSLPLASRRHFFHAFAYMLNSTTAPLLEEKQLQTILDAVDGESDPQLVLCTFQIHEVLAAYAAPATFATVAQEYFESLSSYFPIVFAKPPGCVVTKKDLRDALAAAMKLEAYKEYCVPFLFGKLASPSFSVKDDVLDTLRQCLVAYGDTSVKELAAEVVTQLRNEILKLSAYSDHDRNPALSNQIDMCCEAMRIVSRRYSEWEASKDELLKVFEPVSEGLIASSSAAMPGSQTCAAYATMMFHIVTGGWLACLYVGSYALTMLTLTVHDKDVTPESAILISGICSGLMDALSTFSTQGYTKDELRESLQTAAPMLADCGKRAAIAMQKRDQTSGVQVTNEEAEGPSLTDSSSTAYSSTILAALCLAECVASVIKLSTVLDPLIAYDDVTALAGGLALAAQTHDPTVAGPQMAKLFCSCLGLPNSRACLKVLSDMVTLPSDVNAEHGHYQPPSASTLRFLGRVGGASPEAAELVLVHGLFSESSSLFSARHSAVTSADIAATALTVLTSSNEPRCDADVLRFLSLPKLTGDATFFQCTCHVYTKASQDLCRERLAALPGGVPLVETAALLSSRIDIVVPPETAQTVAQALQAECASRGTTFVLPALNGITGLVRSGVTVAFASPCGVSPQQLEIAVLWGKILRDEEVDTSDLIDSLSLFLTSNGGTEEEPALSALSYFPCVASLMAKRTDSLLEWFVKAGDVVHSDSLPFFWEGLAVLLTNELPATIERCLSSLITLCERAAGNIDNAMLSRVMLEAARHAGGSELTLAHAALRSRRLRAALIAGATSPSMSTRCESLNFLGTLASAAAVPPNAEAAGSLTKEDVKEARKDILHAAQCALSDRKRIVRQAAAKCRREWFRSQTQ